MKTLFPSRKFFTTSKTTLLTIILLGSLIKGVFGQVPTVVLNGNRIEDYVPFYSDKNIQPYILPEVDIEATLKDDIKNGIEAPRFGIKIPTNLSESDGETQKISSFVIWRKSFYASKAKSLNFEFNDLKIPSGAQIYIYNQSGTMFSGPIEGIHVHYNKYSSDIIQGNEIIIQAIIPKTEYGKFSIKISNVIFGFINMGPEPKSKGESRDYDDSLPCTVDVNCDAGSSWHDERDAVAMILVDNTRICSGTLLNTTCEELEGFFLTAQHCIDGATGHLGWTFRFNYDSQNPTDLNDCRGDEPVTWLTYSGADVISQWGPGSGSDFGLLQLSGSVIGQPTIALAGWDRTDYTPNSGVCIGHPQGDVKKISIDDDALHIEGNNGGGGSQYLRAIWDTGLTEGGSSGSALFDGFYQQVVGQLSGGEEADCEDSTPTDWFGRFFISWTGGGTSTTRLSDWLGSSTTTDLIKSPYVGAASLGPLCTTNRSYLLSNLIPGRSATWAVSPTNLFATTSGANTSGSGSTAVLRAASSSSSGLATLTFTISTGSGCNTNPVSYSIWVGKPGGTLELEDDNICIHEEGIAFIDWAADNNVMGVYSTVWTYSGPIDDFNGGSAIAKYSGSTSGHGYINVNRTNLCGTQPLSVPYQISDCGRSSEILTQVFPNPSTGIIFVSLSKKDEKTSYTSPQGTTGKIYIYDKLGHIVLEENLNSNYQEINTSHLQPDIYILEVQSGEVKSRTKLMIIK